MIMVKRVKGYVNSDTVGSLLRMVANRPWWPRVHALPILTRIPVLF
jgi:hypothetical protein